jgi:transcriptional regulator GlxA family with amidase domain
VEVTAHPFRTVAAYLPPAAASLGLGIVAEVFGYDRTARGVPDFDLVTCAARPGPVGTDAGLTLMVEHGLDRLITADLVMVLAGERDRSEGPPAEVLDALREAHRRGAVVASLCTGAFTLARAGVLDGRRATTHWRWADEFATRHPAVNLDRDVLYVDEDRLLTSAGAVAGADLCLYLLRREYGAAVATEVARDMVVPPHRDGGQAQFIAAPMPASCDDERLTGVIAWARAQLHRPLTVDQLATRALMSPRSFARRFRTATGATPHAWLLSQRLQHAEELLERTDLAVEEVARRTGFGTAAALREQFVRRRGVPPRDYRRAFGPR